MAKLRNKTTIILVDKNQTARKPIQIPTNYVLHWKKYVLTIVGVFILLIVSIGYLLKSKTDADLVQVRLEKEIKKHKQQLSAVDTTSLKKYYASIDKKLVKINKYLKARGIKPILTENKGGESSNDLLSEEEIAVFYESYLNRIERNVAFTPMGYPFKGVITSGYGHRENPFTGENVETHKGLDIRASYGDLVKATANGKIIFAGSRGGYGNCVVIQHGNGFQTYYGHLSRILVRNGQSIESGNYIGKVGSTGRSTGPHLHYEIHKNGKVINPRSFLTLE
ncbi:M23 family metallopeptidase [Pedobacter sp. MW01-1-1]|uniref:M23 family metallopeptidase n=1 Tax=Pedobacter sp. MW01-1-1 TaxID=3383027 RepID=UPI003FED4BBC